MFQDSRFPPVFDICEKSNHFGMQRMPLHNPEMSIYMPNRPEASCSEGANFSTNQPNGENSLLIALKSAKIK